MPFCYFEKRIIKNCRSPPFGDLNETNSNLQGGRSDGICIIRFADGTRKETEVYL